MQQVYDPLSAAGKVVSRGSPLECKYWNCEVQNMHSVERITILKLSAAAETNHKSILKFGGKQR